MKRFLFMMLMTISLVILNVTDTCLASDDWECMFCHQYPGLVMPQGAAGFKIISIDRNKYFASPHGKAACRACHNRVDSIPHTGATEVTCTTGCHIEDREKIETMDRSSYRVHRDDQRSIISIQDRSSCRVCHPVHPHSRNLKVRAILNMHMGYMLCGLCHLKKEGLTGIVYDWKAPDNAAFIGIPYGRNTVIKPDRIQSAWNYISGLFRRLISGETPPGETGAPEYMIFRIAAFSGEKENRILLVDTEDPVKTAQFRAREKNLSADEREKELKYFHRDITEHEFSVACNECHSSKGILNFKQLGYNDKKARALRDFDVKRLETEYKIFHFPYMLK
jgi:hypothetical protein